ncbi:hypothetical protein IFM89_029207 [Coptis chinensis]|uniref:Uncharacterized protein n=1 Tax=Coptis chinensis TaxID=261450 RepID=A0A835ISQ5_9MAGN|nr:hypothetical protein IFM89_029207 [Coptis chinensis]
MAMKNMIPKASKNCFYLILIIVVLLLSIQLSLVQGRALRSTGTSNGCEQEGGAENSVGIASFLVSSNNSSSYASTVRSLAFKLASGPSKKGPGH